jgi:hypothetical protein
MADLVTDEQLTETLNKRDSLMLGMAQLSALTLKIDKLLQTSRVSQSAVLSSSLKAIKRDLLLGLTKVQQGSR